MSRLTATPWSTRDKSDATVSFKDATPEEEAKQKQIEAVPKAFRINYSDLIKHGFTDHCPQCDHNARFMKSKGGVSHTAACRTRILNAMMSTPEGDTFWITTGPEFSVTEHNSLDEPIWATPAIVEGTIYLRGNSHLYAIGGTDDSP